MISGLKIASYCIVKKPETNAESSTPNFITCDGLNENQCNVYQDKCKFYENICQSLEIVKQKKEAKKRLKAQKLEDQRLEAEILEQERLKAQRLEQERLEAEAKRLEAETLEQERLRAQRLEQERLEAQRLEQERLEAQRLEQERLTAEAEKRLKPPRSAEKTQEIQDFILEVQGMFHRLPTGISEKKENITRSFLQRLISYENDMTPEELEKIKEIKMKLTASVNVYDDEKNNQTINMYILQNLLQKIENLDLNLIRFDTKLNNSNDQPELIKFKIASEQLTILEANSKDINEIETQLKKQTVSAQATMQKNNAQRKFETLKVNFNIARSNAQIFLINPLKFTYENSNYLLNVQTETEGKDSIRESIYNSDWEKNLSIMTNALLFTKAYPEFEEIFISYQEKNPAFKYNDLNKNLTLVFLKFLWKQLLEDNQSIIRWNGRIDYKELNTITLQIDLLEKSADFLKVDQEEKDALANLKNDFNEKWNKSPLKIELTRFQAFISKIQQWKEKTIIESLAGTKQTSTTVAKYSDYINDFNKDFEFLKDSIQKYPYLFSNIQNIENYFKRIRALIDEMQSINIAENTLSTPPDTGFTKEVLIDLVRLTKLNSLEIANTDEFPIAKERYEKVNKQLDIELGKLVDK